MGRKRGFLGFLSALFLSFFVANAFAAGYTCETDMYYTSCNPGYYLENGDCKDCPDGKTCPGGTAEPFDPEKTTRCQPGYYIKAGKTSCDTLCTAGYVCPGGDYTIPANGAESDLGIESCADYTGDSKFTSSAGAIEASDCYITINNGGVMYSFAEKKIVACPAGYYCESGAKAYYYKCDYDEDGVCLGGNFEQCPNGYTSDEYSTSDDDCYQTCTMPCIQQECPGNATCKYGTESSTGTKYLSGDCDATQLQCSITITCKDGYYLDDNGACTICPVGHYCTGGTKHACQGRTEYNNVTGATQCKTVSAGYYATGCTNGNACTGQYKCTVGTYCENGVSKSCPEGTTTTVSGATSADACIDNPCDGVDESGEVGSGFCVKAGEYMLYSGEVKDCAENYYCPGGFYDEYDYTYDCPENDQCYGIKECPSGYTSSGGSYYADECYVEVTINHNNGTGNTYSTYVYYGETFDVSYYASLWTPRLGYKYTGLFDDDSSCTAPMSSYKYGDSSAEKTKWYMCSAPASYVVTLDNNGADTAGSGNVYTTYSTGVYLDQAHDKSMEGGANKITTPSRKFDVTYIPNGGTLSTMTNSVDGVFGGYFNDNKATTQYIDNSGALTENGLNAGKALYTNTKWYAKWTPGKVVLPNPTRNHYTFAGWYEDEGLTSFAGDAGDTYQLTADDQKLYAKWDIIQFNISYSCGTGAGTPPSSVTVNSGTELTLPLGTDGNCTLSNQYQTGWTDGSNTYAVGVTITPTKDTQFSAEWSQCYAATAGSGVDTAQLVGVVNNVCQYKHTCKPGFYHANHGKQTENSSINCSPCTGLPDNATWGGAATTNSCAWDCNACVTGNNAASCSVTKGTNSCTYAGTCAENTFAPVASGVTVSCTACPSNSVTNAKNTSSSCTCKPYYSVGGSQTGSTTTTNTSCTPIVYNITYNLGNGTNNSGNPNTYHVNTAKFTLGAPTRSNSNFAGWFDNNGTQVTSVDKGSHGNLVLNAKWTCVEGYSEKTDGTACQANKYTVKYNANGGTGTMADVVHTYNEDKKLSANAFTNGTNKFNGWNTKPNGSGTAYADGVTVKNLTADNNGSVTMYAQWTSCTACAAGTGANCTLSAPLGVCTYATSCKPGYNTITNEGKYNPSCTANKYTVKYNANGGTGTMADVVHTYNEDKKLSANAFTNGTNKFNGWNTKADGSGTAYADGVTVKNLTADNNGSVTMYAQWTSCTACAAGTGANCTLSAPLGVCTYATSCKPGYNTISNDGKYNPSCKANKYTVTYSCGDGTGSAPSNGTATYNSDFTPETNTCTNAGFDFGGWNDGTTIRTAGTAFKWEYTSDKTFTATWNPKGATTITYNKNGGTINGDYTTACNVETATFSLPSDVTRAGYTFGGWYANESLTGNAVTTVEKGTCTSGLVYWAKWTENTDTKYTVNHYIQNLGATSYKLDSTDNMTGTTNANVTLTNLTKTITGFTYDSGFAGTATNGTTKPTSGAVTTTTILPAGNRVIDLYYTRNTYDVTINKNGGSGNLTVNDVTKSGTDNVTFTCSYEETFALPAWDGSNNALTKSNSTFKGWNLTSPVTCDGDKTISATWTNCTAASKGTGVDTAQLVGVVDNVCQYKHTCATGYWNASHNSQTTASSITCTICPEDYRNGNGTTKENLCVGSFTKNGVQNSCTKPTNAHSYSCTTCTPGTCNYLKNYAGTITKDCTPTNCDQDVESFTCLANYYVNASGACSPCGANSSTNVGNTSNSCTCTQGYSADGTPDGEKTTTSADCTAITYSIEYEINGGQNYTNAPESYTYGVGTTINGTPTRTGYSFQGWCSDSGLKENCSKTVTLEKTDIGNKKYYAKWDANTYTVTYSCGDGAGSAPSDGTATYDSDFTPATNTCTNAGFDFGGWHDGTTIRTAGTAFKWEYTSDKTFTATWNPKGATTITYNKNGGTINGNYTTACNVETATFSLPSDVTRAGYTFGGWYANESLTGNAVTTVEKGTCTSGLVYWAKWTECNSTSDGACNCATGTYPKNGTCTNCVTSCAAVSGYTNGNYNICSGSTDTCLRGCTASDVVGAVSVSGDISKDGTTTNTCKATSCKSGYYLESGECKTLSGYTCPGGTNGKDKCYKSCTVACNPQTCPDNAASCTNGTESSQGTQYYGGSCDAKAVSCSLIVNKCDSGLLLKNNTCTSCPDNATCDGTNDWTCDTNYNKSTSGCVLGVVKCVTGKAADGSACTPGFYCPGGDVNAGDENDTTIGCERACPSATGKTITSPNGATQNTQCTASGAVDIYSEDKSITENTGTGTETCNWNGKDAYNTSCNTIPTKCDAGFYRPSDNSPFCNAVGYGFYRAQSEGIRVHNSCSDLKGAQTNVNTKTTVSEAATECFNTCSSIATSDGKGVRIPVNTTESYNGTEIPECTYKTSCYDGYAPDGESCVAQTYTITLNHNGGTSGVDAIYQKYDIGWYDNAGNSILSIQKPTLTGQTFGGYLSGNTVVINNSGVIEAQPNLFKSNASINAIWSNNPTIVCKAGTYYPGTGSSCLPCTAGSYCEGVSAVQETGEAGRKTCASLNGTYTAATDEDGNPLIVSINSPAQSDSASDCYAINVAYAPNQYTTGKQTCYYNDTSKSYDWPCVDMTVTQCAGGYALTADDQTICSAVGYGYFSPDKSLAAEQCPLNKDTNTRGTTQSKTAVSIEACIMDNLWFENETSGQRRQCFWSEASGAYDRNCPQSNVVTCIAGYWYDSSLFENDSTTEKYCVPVGDGAWSPAQSDCNGEDLQPTATGCSTKKNSCPGGALTGREDASSELHCEGVCPAGSYCVDGVEYSCSTETNGEYPLSQAGSNEIGDCYKEGCTQRCSRLDPFEVGTELCVPRGTTYAMCSYYQGYFTGVNYQSAPTVCVIHPEKTLAETCPVTLVSCPANYYYAPVGNFDTGKCQPCKSLGNGQYNSSHSLTYYKPDSNTGEKACYMTAPLMCTQPVCPLEGTGTCKYDASQQKAGGGYLFYGTSVALPGRASAFMCETIWSCNTGYDKNENANIDPTDDVTDSTPAELCTPHVYTMTLKHDYEGGTNFDIYQKYKVGWYEDSTAVSKIADAGTSGAKIVDIPERQNYTFNGYFSACVGPANMIIDANGEFVSGDAINATYIDNTEVCAQWTRNVYQCQPGKYYKSNADASDSVLVDCVAPYYCPGVGSVNVGATGCYEECPTPQVTPIKKPETIAGAQTEVTSCYANFAQNPLSGAELANGDGTWVCQYSGTSTQGEYANCNIIVNTCDAGYYNQSGTNTCSEVASGYYSPDGDLSQTTCPPKTNYTIGTDVLRDAKTDCYVACTSYVPDVDHSSDVYVTAGDKYQKMFWADTDNAYPACHYTVECETGYTAVSGTTPQCKANEYDITLDKNGGTGDIANTVRCVFDSGVCTLPATDVLKRTGYNTVNKWCVNPDGTGACYEAGKNTSANISVNGSNVKLYAIWTPAVFEVKLSAPDATVNANQEPIYLKYATGWFSDADAKKPITSIGTNLPGKGNGAYLFAGYKLNDVTIVGADGQISVSGDALTVTAANATATVEWSRGLTTCEAGFYYPGTGSECQICLPNHYCPAGQYPTDSESKGGLNPCPNEGLSAGGKDATNITVCYKPGMAYATYIDADNNYPRATGTWTCNYETIGYTNCHNDTVEIAWCTGGYWYDNAQDAIDCIAVGQDNWSAEAELVKHECPDGGNTNGALTSDSLTDCQKRVDTYTADSNNAKGSHVCSARLDEQVVKYDQNCKKDTIKVTWCAGGYWYDENYSTIDCAEVGIGRYSPVGDMSPYDCPSGGTTTITNATTPDGVCQKTKIYPGIEYTGDDVHGMGVHGCVYDENADGLMFGNEKSDGYVSCGKITMTECESGYWWQNGETVCKPVDYNHFGPIADVNNSGYPTGRMACPDSGLTNGTLSADATACYLEKLSCDIVNGSGEQTRFYDNASVADTAGYNKCFANGQVVGCDTMCTITGCDTGFSLVNGNCINCPVDNVCVPGQGQRSCADATGGTHTKADSGTTDVAYCFADCALGENAYEMTGRDYYGADVTDTCKITACAAGYILNDGKCTECPDGMICNPELGDGLPKTCEALTNGEHTLSDKKSDKIEDCYQICEAYEIINGTAIPLEDVVYYPNKCQYKGISTNGNPCNIQGDTCIETSCNYNFEMVNGICKPCARDNAISYKRDGNCIVESCEKGYHPNGQQCESNVVECTVPNAVVAQQTWNTKTNKFDACKILKCAEGYHLGANACQEDVQVCELEHGVGVREWDHDANTWGECIATKCDPGYTNDPSETNELWKQCGRCNNMFGAKGEIAASTYVQGCEIATCMYQYEKYILENNECKLICDTRSDETGTRYWDDTNKKCVHDCFYDKGYIQW